MCKMSSKAKLRKIDMNGDARPDKRIKCAACKLKAQSLLKSPNTPITIDDSDSVEHLEGDHGWGAHAIVNNSKAPAGSTFEFYRRFGYYWTYFPKTDFTYSPTSPFYKKEIAPGIPVIPNLSRRPIRPNLGSKSSFSGSLVTSSEDDSHSSSFYCTNCSSGQQEQNVRKVNGGGVVRRVLSEAYRVVVSTVTRTFTVVEEEETTQSAAVAIAGTGFTNMERLKRRSGYETSAAVSGTTVTNKERLTRGSGNGGVTKLGAENSDASHTWTGEDMLTSTPVVKKRRNGTAISAYACGGPCLLASFVIALVSVLLAHLLLFPPEEVDCTNGVCESLAIAEGSAWRWAENWTPYWHEWLSPYAWWTGVSAWSAAWWPSWTFVAAPVPCAKDCKTDTALVNSALERIAVLEDKFNERLSKLEDQITDKDQLTNLNIETMKHQISEVKTQISGIEKAGVSERRRASSISALDYPKEFADLVDTAISRYHADRISLPDYALLSSGGEVISIRCTIGHKSSAAYYSIFGFPVAAKSISPDVILTPGTMPGDCWPFEGPAGTIVVQLSRQIKVTSFTIDHAPKEILPQGNYASAPKDFSVYGLADLNDKEPVLLGQFRFEDNGSSVQHFKALEVDKTFNIIELTIHSNHGHLQYTCLYRFRVHGEPVDQEDFTRGPSL